MSTLLTDVDDDAAGWGRLDVRTILVRPFAQIGQLLPPLVGVLFVGRSISGLWTGILAAVVVLGAGAIAYLTTRYRITEEQVQVRTGLVSRSRQAAPRDRVRTVEATAPLVHRLLGVVRVRIGTGTAGASELVLDAVSGTELDALRSALLHRDGRVGDTTRDAAPTAPGEEILLRWNPRWAAYAPLSSTGIAALAAFFALAFQFGDDLGLGDRAEAVGSGLRDVALPLLVLGGLVVLLAVAALAAVVLNVLSWYGLRLRRGADAGIHVERGLLTTRTVTVEHARLRGVSIVEPLGVRAAGGARLQAIASGLATDDSATGSAELTPPAPRDVVLRLGREVLGPELTTTSLTAHPRAALRRRGSRTLVPLAIVVTAGIVLTVLGLLPWWVTVPGAALGLAAAVALARDRYANLGHAVGTELMLVRQGSLVRRTTALRRTGIVGVTVRASVFQRRAGLCTVELTTAAGAGAYELLDVGSAQGLAAADAALPGLLAPFLVRSR